MMNPLCGGTMVDAVEAISSIEFDGDIGGGGVESFVFVFESGGSEEGIFVWLFDHENNSLDKR